LVTKNRFIKTTQKKVIMKRYLGLIILLVALQSCKEQENIDQIISRLDKVDFTSLKGTFIHFRSKGHSSNTNIYFVAASEATCAPYVIEVDKANTDSLIIKNDLVLKSCGQDYLNESKIKSLISDYLKLDVCLINVDDWGNVYINPDEQELPTLLRISGNTLPKDINQFESYKENWYVRK